MLKPLGPYVLVKKANNFYFISGLLPIEPSTGSIIEGDDYKRFKQVFENLIEVLNANSLSLNDIIKVTVYLKSRNSKLFNEVYKQYFKDNLPARTLIFVDNLPMDADVEIDAIAYKE